MSDQSAMSAFAATSLRDCDRYLRCAPEHRVQCGPALFRLQFAGLGVVSVQLRRYLMHRFVCGHLTLSSSLTVSTFRITSRYRSSLTISRLLTLPRAASSSSAMQSASLAAAMHRSMALA